LRKLNATVERPDNPSIRGMVTKIRHLVEVEEVPALSEPTDRGKSGKTEKKARTDA
jgi:large subunit ribosomal protein L30